jgi:hypothetical protein
MKILNCLDCRDGPTLTDDFIRRVLGNPKAGPVAVVNAQATAQALEGERNEYTKPREKRLVELLRLALPYVQDAHQGRGDKALEKLISEELP